MGENSMMRKVSGIMSLVVFLGACPVSLVSALDNGLARHLRWDGTVGTYFTRT